MRLILQLMLAGTALVVGCYSKHLGYLPKVGYNEKCCSHLHTEDWEAFVKCVNTQGVPPLCVQKRVVCYYNQSIYDIGEMVRVNPKQCQVLKCDFTTKFQLEGFGSDIESDRKGGNYRRPNPHQRILSAQVLTYNVGGSHAYGCCMRENMMYQNTHTLEPHPSPCISEVCRDGRWIREAVPGCSQKPDKSCQFGGDIFLNGEVLSPNPCVSLTCISGTWHQTHSTYCPMCRSPSTPFFYTFDGSAFQFHGHCNYTLVQKGAAAASQDDSFPTITAKFYECDPISPASCATEVVIRQAQDLYVKLMIGGLVTINGVPVGLPYSHPKHPLLIWQEDELIRVLTFNGFIVLYSSGLHKPELGIIAPPSEVGRDWQGGLCGKLHPKANVDVTTKYSFNGKDYSDFVRSWKVGLPHECMEEGSSSTPETCGREMKKEVAKHCRKAIENAGLQGCDPVMDYESCLQYLCECCSKREAEGDCLASCTEQITPIQCKPSKELHHKLSLTEEIKEKSLQFGEVLKPAIEEYSCLLKEWADFSFYYSSILISTIVDLIPSLVVAVEQGQPILAKLLKDVAPFIIEAGRKLSPITRDFLQKLPTYMRILLTRMETTFAENICLWSPGYNENVRVQMDAALDTLGDVFRPILKSSILKIRNHTKSAIGSLISEARKAFMMADHLIDGSDIQDVWCHLTDVLKKEFQIPFKLVVMLDKQIEDSMKTTRRRLNETLSGRYPEGCSTGCPFSKWKTCQHKADKILSSSSSLPGAETTVISYGNDTMSKPVDSPYHKQSPEPSGSNEFPEVANKTENPNHREWEFVHKGGISTDRLQTNPEFQEEHYENNDVSTEEEISSDVPWLPAQDKNVEKYIKGYPMYVSTPHGPRLFHFPYPFPDSTGSFQNDPTLGRFSPGSHIWNWPPFGRPPVQFQLPHFRPMYKPMLKMSTVNDGLRAGRLLGSVLNPENSLTQKEKSSEDTTEERISDYRENKEMSLENYFEVNSKLFGENNIFIRDNSAVFGKSEMNHSSVDENITSADAGEAINRMSDIIQHDSKIQMTDGTNGNETAHEESQVHSVVHAEEEEDTDVKYDISDNIQVHSMEIMADETSIEMNTSNSVQQENATNNTTGVFFHPNTPGTIKEHLTKDVRDKTAVGVEPAGNIRTFFENFLNQRILGYEETNSVDNTSAKVIKTFDKTEELPVDKNNNSVMSVEQSEEVKGQTISRVSETTGMTGFTAVDQIKKYEETTDETQTKIEMYSEKFQGDDDMQNVQDASHEMTNKENETAVKVQIVEGDETRSSKNITEETAIKVKTLEQVIPHFTIDMLEGTVLKDKTPDQIIPHSTNNMLEGTGLKPQTLYQTKPQSTQNIPEGTRLSVQAPDDVISLSTKNMSARTRLTVQAPDMIPPSTNNIQEETGVKVQTPNDMIPLSTTNMPEGTGLKAQIPDHVITLGTKNISEGTGLKVQTPDDMVTLSTNNLLKGTGLKAQIPDHVIPLSIKNMPERTDLKVQTLNQMIPHSINNITEDVILNFRIPDQEEANSTKNVTGARPKVMSPGKVKVNSSENAAEEAGIEDVIKTYSTNNVIEPVKEIKASDEGGNHSPPETEMHEARKERKSYDIFSRQDHLTHPLNYDNNAKDSRATKEMRVSANNQDLVQMQHPGSEKEKKTNEETLKSSQSDVNVKPTENADTAKRFEEDDSYRKFGEMFRTFGLDLDESELVVEYLQNVAEKRKAL